MTDKLKLQEMVNSILPEAIENSSTALVGLSAQKSELEDQISAVENEVLAPLLSASDAYLELRKVQLGGDTIVKNASYGVSDISNWSIKKTVPNPVPPPPTITTTLLTGAGLTPGGGTTEDQDQYQRQVDYVVAYEHVNDPLGTANGTYGLQPLADATDIGIGIQQKNKAKYEEVLEVYEKFV